MMDAISAIKRMNGKYHVIRTDPLGEVPPDEDDCDADALDFFKPAGLHGNIKLRRGFNCYDANDQASIDTAGVVRILVTAPSRRIWLDTFMPT